MTKELKLEHILHCINGNWYWICPVCKEWLAPHEAGKGKGHFVLQSKGVATKHLISHNAGYVPKGENITEIISKKQYFCNDCGNYALSIKYLKDMNLAKNIKIETEHKYICFHCCKDSLHFEVGLKTKEEVHRGKL